MVRLKRFWISVHFFWKLKRHQPKRSERTHLSTIIHHQRFLLAFFCSIYYYDCCDCCALRVIHVTFIKKETGRSYLSCYEKCLLLCFNRWTGCLHYHWRVCKVQLDICRLDKKVREEALYHCPCWSTSSSKELITIWLCWPNCTYS